MDAFHFQKIADVPAAGDGFSLATTSIADDGTVLFLFVESAARDAITETRQQSGATFPKATMRPPGRCRFLRVSAGLPHIVDVPALDVTFPQIDMFPDGRILIVGSRCSWRGDDDYDLNGVIFHPETGQTSRILLGDGIGAVHVDGLGRIWVGYFDEGIFGNYGWGGPGPLPVGAAGLVCFSDTGEKVWEYPADSPAVIDDCYALNVSGSGAAAHFYTDFPICKISNDFRLQYWQTNLRGSHAFAVSDTQALLSGQYRDPPEIAYLADLAPGQLANVRKIKLRLPDDSPMPKGRLLGRGSHLYFFDSLSVYRLALA